MFTKGFKKTADAASLALRNTNAVKSFAQGANSGGPSMAQGWANLKAGLGFGSSSINTGKMGS